MQNNKCSFFSVSPTPEEPWQPTWMSYADALVIGRTQTTPALPVVEDDPWPALSSFGVDTQVSAADREFVGKVQGGSQVSGGADRGSVGGKVQGDSRASGSRPWVCRGEGAGWFPGVRSSRPWVCQGEGAGWFPGIRGRPWVCRGKVQGGSRASGGADHGSVGGKVQGGSWASGGADHGSVGGKVQGGSQASGGAGRESVGKVQGGSWVSRGVCSGADRKSIGGKEQGGGGSQVSGGAYVGGLHGSGGGGGSCGDGGCCDVRDLRAVVFMHSDDNLSTQQVRDIIQKANVNVNDENNKISTIPPFHPKAGEVYLNYSHDNATVASDWCCDGYHWKSVGTRKLPKSKPYVHKL